MEEEGEIACASDRDDNDIGADSTNKLPESRTAKIPDSPGRPAMRWILLGVASHLAWGLYPVFARYLQVVRGLDGMLVLAVTFVVSLIVIQLITCSGFGGVAAARVGGLYSIVTFGRAATNMLSFKYTLVLYTQLITQLGPFITAFLSRAILQEPLPRFFVIALTASTFGAVLCVLGQSKWSTSELTHSDVIGIGLSILSIFFSAGMRIFMKTSKSTMTEQELISWQYTNAVPLGVAAAMTMSPSAWSHVKALRVSDVLVLSAFVLIIGLFANFAQVTSVRHLGPSLASSLQPLRLVSAIIGGYVALGERLQSLTAWFGVVVIITVISMYLCAQQWRSSGASVMGAVSIKATRYGRVA